MDEVLALFEVEDTPETLEVETPEVLDDDTPELETEGDEQVEQLEQEPQEPQVEVENKSEFKPIAIKYDKHEMTINDESEAARLIQLGMYHEQKIAPEYEAYKTSSQKLSELERTAQLFDMNLDQLNELLLNQHFDQRSEVENVTPEQVKREYELSRKEEAIRSSEKQRLDQETQMKEQQQLDAMYARFAQTYPDVDAKAITQDTWDMVNGGMDLSAAYAIQENKELKKQLSIQKQNSDNKVKSPVKPTATGGTVEVEDEVDEIFMSHFK